MKHTYFAVLALVALMSLVPAVSACSSPVIQPTNVSAQVIDAPLLFANNCAPCHGPNRLGIGLAPNITPPAIILLTEADIVLKLSIHQTGPLLTPAERAAVATFLKNTP
jgi:mono/diheme cytochrome c family protein